MRSRRTPRRGATVVEVTLVLLVCFMLLFGVLEYSRYLYALHLADNAAREGARYAVVNTTAANDADFKDAITSMVRSKVGGLDGTLGNYRVDVSAKVLQDHDGKHAGDLLTDSTQAGPNDGITVTITGNFVPVMPLLLFSRDTVPVQASSTMYSEGN